MDKDTDTDTGHGHGHGRRSTVEKRSTIDFIDDHYQQFEYLLSSNGRSSTCIQMKADDLHALRPSLQDLPA